MMDKPEKKLLPAKAFSKTQFFSIIWVLFGVALAFCVARIAIAWRLYSRLRMDDILVILAMTCLLVSDILKTYTAPTMYIVQAVQAGRISKFKGYKDTADTYAGYQWAAAYLFFTGIWAVKGSFLAFYDVLTNRLAPYRRAWWVTIALTILTYIGSLFAYAFLDGTRFSKVLHNEAIKYQFAADITTDILSKPSTNY
ncbi:MAG: hypothetical protein Q9181_007422 [Wetmoreana brouardii]